MWYTTLKEVTRVLDDTGYVRTTYSDAVGNLE